VVVARGPDRGGGVASFEGAQEAGVAWAARARVEQHFFGFSLLIFFLR
jgi:hypothetical protein